MISRALFAGLLLAVSMPSMAQNMNADEFYQRATKLKKKGAMAVFRMGEVKALMKEGQAAGKASSAKYRADKAAGKPLAYCPPAEARMDSDEYMKLLSAIPAAERRKINMTEATTRIMTIKYPCRT